MAATFQRDEGETLFDQYEMEGEDPELTRLVDDGLGDLPADDALTGKKGGEVGASELLEDGDAVVVRGGTYNACSLSIYLSINRYCCPMTSCVDAFDFPKKRTTYFFLFSSYFSVFFLLCVPIL